MDFSQALVALKSGKRVQRRIWPDGDHGYIELADLPGLDVPVIVAVYSDYRVLFACSQWDVLADDWEIL